MAKSAHRESQQNKLPGAGIHGRFLPEAIREYFAASQLHRPSMPPCLRASRAGWVTRSRLGLSSALRRTMLLNREGLGEVPESTFRQLLILIERFASAVSELVAQLGGPVRGCPAATLTVIAPRRTTSRNDEIAGLAVVIIGAAYEDLPLLGRLHDGGIHGRLIGGGESDGCSIEIDRLEFFFSTRSTCAGHSGIDFSARRISPSSLRRRSTPPALRRATFPPPTITTSFPARSNRMGYA